MHQIERLAYDVRNIEIPVPTSYLGDGRLCGIGKGRRWFFVRGWGSRLLGVMAVVRTSHLMLMLLVERLFGVVGVQVTPDLVNAAR
jgi:hypothetical protein